MTNWRYELEIFHRLVKTDCFYIGALGNHRVHGERLAALSACGISDRELARIDAPVGVISSAKSKATLAVGVLAEVLQHAKALNLICLTLFDPSPTHLNVGKGHTWLRLNRQHGDCCAT
jgi:xanthine/CO dehydrogenase XdhC/CoxF family maturation factor